MVSKPALPVKVGHITRDWLRHALRVGSENDLPDLRSVQVEDVGSGRGLFSQVVRCRLAWADDTPGLPASVIVKLPSTDARTARIAWVLRLYRREYEFYRRLDHGLPLRSPQMLFGDCSFGGRRVALVLEDLAGMIAVPQIQGADAAQAFTAIRAVGRMHALYWNRVDRPPISGFPDYTRQYRRWTQIGYILNLAPALARFGSLFSPEMLRLAETYGPRIADHLRQLSAGPKTFTHGDFRIDNMFLGAVGVDGLKVIDWQNCGVHSGLRDVAYFLSNSVTSGVRRSIEREIVEAYHAALCQAGVTDCTLEECWSLYRNLMLACLVGPIVTCGMLELRDQDSIEMLEAGLARTLAAVEELDADEFLPGRRRIFSAGAIGAGVSITMYKARKAIG